MRIGKQTNKAGLIGCGVGLALLIVLMACHLYDLTAVVFWPAIAPFWNIDGLPRAYLQPLSAAHPAVSAFLQLAGVTSGAFLEFYLLGVLISRIWLGIKLALDLAELVADLGEHR